MTMGDGEILLSSEQADTKLFFFLMGVVPESYIINLIIFGRKKIYFQKMLGWIL